MHVAVTGASGFVGRHLMRALAASDIELTAAARSTERLAEFAHRATLVALDVGDAGTDPFGALGRPDVLVHLAWGGLPNFQSLRHFEVELPRHYAYLQRVIEGGLGSLLATGTCLEYGMQNGPLSEEVVCSPANPYALAKHMLHSQLTLLKGERPFKFTWARLFYTYGEGQSATSVWPQFQAALARGDASFDMSGGDQLRDFLPIEQLATELARLALAGRDVGAVNICSGRPRAVRSIVEGWVAASGKNIRLNLGRYPYPDYEPMAFWGTREKLDEVTAAARDHNKPTVG